MFKNIRDFNFREIIGHFVLMRNTDIVKNPQKYEFIDEQIEEIKKDIVNNTFDYYKGQNEEADVEDFINMDALNEEMTTRKVTDLHEPIYAYIGVDSVRGSVVYFLGNEEDKVRFVYATSFLKLNNPKLDNTEIEIIDEYPYEAELKNQIKDEEESDEDVIKTREIKEIDIYRSDYSPDFVNCIVPFADAEYSAKVKLEKIQDGIIYGLYHDIEGIITIQKNNEMNYLLFKPMNKIDDIEALNDFVKSIIDCFTTDYGATQDQIEQIVEVYEEMIKNSYIKGDLPFETIGKIWDDMTNNKQG